MKDKTLCTHFFNNGGRVAYKHYGRDYYLSAMRLDYRFGKYIIVNMYRTPYTGYGAHEECIYQFNSKRDAYAKFNELAV